MSKWTVDPGTRRRVMSETSLRRHLRRGTLTGMERVQRAGELQWRTLHEMAVFREEVAFVGAPEFAARELRARERLGAAGLLTLAAVAIHFLTGDLWWLASVALTLALAALLSALFQVRALRAISGATDDPALVDPTLEALDEALARRVRDDLRVLHERRRALELALIDCEPRVLWRELAHVRERATDADRDEDRDAFENHATTLEEHLRAIQDAQRARDRLAANGRELLHNLEALRLALLGTGIDATGPTQRVCETLDQFRATLETEAEAEEVLGRARRAAAWER